MLELEEERPFGLQLSTASSWAATLYGEFPLNSPKETVLRFFERRYVLSPQFDILVNGLEGNGLII